MNTLLKIRLTSDSDCYTIIYDKKSMIDYETNVNVHITNKNKNKVLNDIIKNLKSTTYEDSDKHYTIINDIKTFNKIGVSLVMKKLNEQLINTLKNCKSKKLNELIGFNIEKGGNQNFKISFENKY